jgi:hypothetical protein
MLPSGIRISEKPSPASRDEVQKGPHHPENQIRFIVTEPWLFCLDSKAEIGP